MTGSKYILGKTILLVDDDPRFMTLLKQALAVDQHVVTEAGNGKEAWQLYAPGNFDLVITDLEMPEMNGDELAKAIRTLQPSQRIIMITGSLRKLKQPEVAMDAVLTKPITLEDLRQTIATVLSNEPDNLPSD